MFATCWIEHCETCRENTPHSRRLLTANIVIAFIFGLEGLYLTFAGPWPAGVVALFVGLVIFLRGREKSRHIRCERCRWKRAKEYRNTGPTLDGNTEINVL